MEYHSSPLDRPDPEDRSVTPDKINAGRDASEVCTLHWYEADQYRRDARALLPAVAKRALSSQVMEYYRKYSQNSSLGSYFSLAEPLPAQSLVYHQRGCAGSGPDAARGNSTIPAIDEPSGRGKPRERRRWARPPLVGQPSRTRFGTESRTPSPTVERVLDDTIPEEKSEESREHWDNETTKASVSPASSVASHKPLEWDSGADVGYFNSSLPQRKEDKLRERILTARGNSVAMRLDPEGTNESNANSSLTKTTQPVANSTPLNGHSGQYATDMEITPIAKSNAEAEESLPDNPMSDSAERRPSTEQAKDADDPRSKETESPLTKSTSMNLLALPMSKLSLKRSQSELNLRAKGRSTLPLIFNSTSSIATIVNKPTTCDKLVQTSLVCSRESVGIQVEVSKEEAPKESEDRIDGDKRIEEKPPLPERSGSLVPLHSILKKANETGTKRDEKIRDKRDKNESTEIDRSASSERSRSSTKSEILVETEENATGRTSDSFEYFPGNSCRNVPNGSRQSSSETGRESRCSTMPNTSSSIDEKLWGDSDSLVRDLERSVNILKSLVDSKKCDKQVKKRLIHHVIKRLVTAKYTDDRIERDLDENVPWNPADARNKVYRNDIIQALASNDQQRATTDTSAAEEWTPRKRNPGTRGNSATRKSLVQETRVIEEMIDLATSSRDNGTTNGDDIFDANTDRTLMDGRKARMGLRSEDREGNTDAERSQSSECFVPQSQSHHKINGTNVFYPNKNGETQNARNGSLPKTTGTEATTSTSDSQGNLISDGIILVKERRRTETNGTDWRLPTTMSERRFELGRFGNSVSGDAKLINYAEMEKQNQLVWITNEISHLCNLKRLLEEPSNKVETRSRTGDSPKKKFNGATIGQWIVQARNGRNFSSRSERVPGGADTGVENEWSSHGNLASGRSDRGLIISSQREEDRAVGHTRKRNSCTQTGSDGGPSGHSATGGEIISGSSSVHPTTVNPSRRERSLTSTRDACVQTRFLNGEKTSKLSRVQDVQSTSVESSSFPEVESNEKGWPRQGHVCYCQRYAAHSRHRACVVHSPQRSGHRHTEDCSRSRLKTQTSLITQPIFGTSSSPKRVDSRKEAKNQLNATCKSNYAIRSLPSKIEGRCATCDAEESKTSTSGKDICACSIDGESEVERNDDHRDRKLDANHDDSSLGCTCNLDNQLGKKSRTTVDRRIPKNSPTNEINTEKLCKSCRTCGTVWPVVNGKNPNRKCKCSQDYLKPVAYELNFDKTVVDKPRNAGSKRSVRDKISSSESSGKNKSQTKTGQSSSNGENPAGKCLCEENDKDVDKDENIDDDRPETLKDFLATNKPEFLENVETRRRYMNELSQLRQLKREKRKQFLAVAGASAFMKPQRSTKGSTATAQRKLSDHEMKMRLRTRYLCLNEVRNKKHQREKEEDARRNHLMAKLFGQKLQQKVLKGQVDLSQSVSVISNL